MNPEAEPAGVTLGVDADPVTCFECTVVQSVCLHQITVQSLKIYYA